MKKLGEVILTSLYEQSNTKKLGGKIKIKKNHGKKLFARLWNAADSDEDAKACSDRGNRLYNWEIRRHIMLDQQVLEDIYTIAEKGWNPSDADRAGTGDV